MKIINATMLRNALRNATGNLEANKDLVNSLNVFPVPDGDTGINMFLTIQSASKYGLQIEDAHCGKIMTAASKGALMGARGNSGVILSQILRGFAKSVAENEELTVADVAQALDMSREIAYKAVMKPTEGTILTVIREIAEFASSNYKNYSECNEFLAACIEIGEKSLANTPELLPVLKQAGVVDSGGKGLMVILHGFLDGIEGKETDYVIAETVEKQDEIVTDGEEIKFGYCTEFMVHTDYNDLETFKNKLLDMGDSLVCFKSDDIIKVHVHTNDPGLALQLGLEHGYLTNMKIENMREQNKAVREAHHAETIKEIPHKDDAFISVCAGSGIEALFRDLEVDEIVRGGQTMNPSVEDIINAVNMVNADNIYVLPNNSNIILTAENAARMTDKNVIVIPTKTVPQGISAMISFVHGESAETNTKAMKEAVDNVISGSLTYAVRDTEIDGHDIKEGDYMGLINGSIMYNSTDRQEVLIKSLEGSVTDDSAIVTLFAGDMIDDETMEKDAAAIAEAFPDIEVETLRGEQPVYYYLISIE